MNRAQRRFVRRLVSITVYAAAFVLLAAAFVPLAVLFAIFDVVHGSKRFVLVRTLVFLLWYFACEIAGIAAAAWVWLASRELAGGDRASYLARNRALERRWLRVLGRGALAIFDLRLDVRTLGAAAGSYRYGERPVLVFVRHASAADALLDSLVLPLPPAMRLRRVLRRDRLWDPCIDIVGNRLANVFVRRELSPSDREISAIARLARDLPPNDGVLSYPEGMPFSPGRKARAAASCRDRGMLEAAREAERLRHVLPPRAPSAAALLDATPGADVGFVAHTGLEAASSFVRVLRGGLVGNTVHVGIDVVPAAAVPRGRQARHEWLMQRWRLVDRFIDEHVDPLRAQREPEPVRLRLVR